MTNDQKICGDCSKWDGCDGQLAEYECCPEYDNRHTEDIGEYIEAEPNDWEGIGL